MQQVCQHRADVCKYSKVLDMAQKYIVPQPLAWSIILQEKTDFEFYLTLTGLKIRIILRPNVKFGAFKFPQIKLV